jgi:hypothetical protein
MIQFCFFRKFYRLYKRVQHLKSHANHRKTGRRDRAKSPGVCLKDKRSRNGSESVKPHYRKKISYNVKNFTKIR